MVTSFAYPNRSAAIKAAWTCAAGTTAPSNSWSRVAQASWTTTHLYPRSPAARTPASGQGGLGRELGGGGQGQRVVVDEVRDAA